MKLILFLFLIYIGSKYGIDLIWKIFIDRRDHNGNDDC